MSSMLGSQGLVWATAMAVSAGTVILLDLFRVRYFPAIHISDRQDYPPDQKQIIKSGLSSAGKNKDRARKKKKRVHFAADVKSLSGNGEEYRRKQMRKFTESRTNCCENEIVGTPGNRMALYTGILKDRFKEWNSPISPFVFSSSSSSNVKTEELGKRGLAVICK